MSEVNEITSINVKVGRELNKLILTDNYVTMHSKRSIYNEATTIIPISSIDSIFFGWKRYTLLAIISAITFLGGAVLSIDDTSIGGLTIALSICVFIAFWLIKPHLLLVKSVKSDLGGCPSSAEEATKFINSITEAIGRTRG